MSPSATLAEDVLAVGRRAGLDRVGICDASPFLQARAAIEERKARGLHAGMQFTFRNPGRSTDPSRALPGAEALVVGARSYARAEPDRSGPTAGSVARYSWTDHYAALRQALAAVADRLRANGYAAKVLADDNALVDRAAAVRAGLGWYGKNANVLLPGAGSLFVLGSVVTDAPIAPSRPPDSQGDGCGSCHKCINDCPTSAIISPGVIDARRCLAWLLQAGGDFPIEFRVALGDRIYGCDECQAGCPVNRRALRRHPPPPPEHGAQVTVDVLDLLESDDATIERSVGRWYIAGREMRYVRRNALVVLGNVGDRSDPRVRAAIERSLSDPDPMIRRHAEWAAGRLGLPASAAPPA